jgi:hypothetical protein
VVASQTESMLRIWYNRHYSWNGLGILFTSVLYRPIEILIYLPVSFPSGKIFCINALTIASKIN